jgi:hypothetical protein
VRILARDGRLSIRDRAREIRQKENPMTNRKPPEDRVAAHFERERHLVELLMHRLGRPAHGYRDPNSDAGRETGVDVLMVSNGRRIGIQVTEIDTGHVQGRARAEEKKAWRDSGLATYGAWAQNDADKVLASVQRAVRRKVEIAERHSFDGFDAVWLLASGGLPEMGAVASTLIMSPWLNAAALDVVTLDCLARSKKYERAYLHCILGVEHALYSWRRGGRWTKEVQQEPQWMRGPSFWDVQKLMQSQGAIQAVQSCPPSGIE